MGLTKQQANLRLSQISSLEQLRDLIQELDVTGTGRTTLLWSGSVGKYGSSGSERISAQRLAESIASQYSDFRLLSNTEAGKFFDLDRASPTFNHALASKLDELFADNPDGLYSYLYGAEDPVTKKRIGKGVWDVVSDKFASEAKGAVRLIVGGGGNDRIFAQTELPAILRNPAVTSIEGIPIQSLRDSLNKIGFDRVLNLLRLSSDVTSGMIRIQVDSSGIPGMNSNQTYNIDPADYINMRRSNAPLAQGVLPIMDFIPKERKVRHAMAVREIYQIHPIMQLQGYFPPRMIDPRGLPSILARVGNYAGVAGDVLSGPRPFAWCKTRGPNALIRG